MFSVKVFNSKGRFVGMAKTPTTDQSAQEIAVKESKRKRNWRAEVYFGSTLTSAFVNGMTLLNPKPIEGA